MRKERRKHFLINKPFQLRYMGILTGVLLIVLGIAFSSLYFGIWGSVLDAFSDEKIRNELVIASRMLEYEKARILSDEPAQNLGFFKQAEKLSERQRDVFRKILNETNKALAPKIFLLLALIAWASIYLSHKIAGPFYRFQASLREIREGNLSTRMFLRHSDEGQYLADQFNQTAEYLDRLAAEIKQTIQKNSSDPKKMAQELEAQLSRLKTSADG